MSMIIPGAGVPVIKHARKTVTFTGATNFGEAGSNVTVFTASGTFIVYLLVVRCTADLTESGATATLTMGSAGSTASLRAAVNAVNIDSGELWGPTGTLSAEVERLTVQPQADGELAAGSTDIVFRPAVTNVTGGTIVVDIWYIPVTDGASLT